MALGCLQDGLAIARVNGLLVERERDGCWPNFKGPCAGVHQASRLSAG